MFRVLIYMRARIPDCMVHTAGLNPFLKSSHDTELIGSDHGFGFGARCHRQRDQSVSSLNPRPLKIIGTHLSARAARVFACFAPET